MQCQACDLEEPVVLLLDLPVPPANAIRTVSGVADAASGWYQLRRWLLPAPQDMVDPSVTKSNRHSKVWK